MQKNIRLTTVISAVAVIIGWTVTMIVPAPAQTGGGNRVATPGQQSATPQGVRVFYASHSLMWYVPKPLGEMSEAAGIEGHKLVGLQSLGASTTLQHWNLGGEKNEAKKALQTGQVDVLVLSPISFPDEGIENFVKLGLERMALPLAA